MQTSRTFKTTVYSGMGPMVDMKITQEAQILAWGNYKGQLRTLLNKSGTKKINGVEVYKNIDLMGDIMSDKNTTNEILTLLGMEDKDLQELKDAQKDLKELYIDFNGNNVLSPDSWQLALEYVYNAVEKVDKITIEGLTKVTDDSVKYKAIDPWWNTDTPTSTTSKINDYKIRFWKNNKDITPSINPDIRRALLASRLLEGNNALMLQATEKKNSLWVQTFDAQFKRDTLMRAYDKTYAYDNEHAKVITNGTGVKAPYYTFHIWALLEVIARRDKPKDPWDQLNPDTGDLDRISSDYQKRRKKLLEASTKLASKWFIYDPLTNSRYLTVEGFKKMRLPEMAWISRFINVGYSRDCGFWCGLFGAIFGAIRALASLVGTLLSFGNESLKKLFTAIADAIIKFYVFSFMGGANFVSIFELGAMDLLSLGISAFQTFGELDQIDYDLDMARDKNDLLNDKVDDPIEMVKVDGTGDANDWERKYYQMYDMMFDSAQVFAYANEDRVKEFGKQY